MPDGIHSHTHRLATCRQEFKVWCNNPSKYTEVIKERKSGNTEVEKKMEEGLNLAGWRKTMKDRSKAGSFPASAFLSVWHSSQVAELECQKWRRALSFACTILGAFLLCLHYMISWSASLMKKHPQSLKPLWVGLSHGL